jgi:hypothetical protein
VASDTDHVSDPVVEIEQYAAQAVVYVKRSLGIALEYDSDTLPLLDHYLRNLETTEPGALDLIVTTAGSYFGEVVRRRIGGRWERSDDNDPKGWRLVLTTGLQFSPAGFVASSIAQSDVGDFDSAIDAPERMLPYVEQALSRMGEITEVEYYSLCGRLDTVEHLHEVLVAVAAKLLGEQNAGNPDVDPDSDADMDADEDTVTTDEPAVALIDVAISVKQSAGDELN